MIAGMIGSLLAMVLILLLRPDWPTTMVLAVLCGLVAGRLA